MIEFQCPQCGAPFSVDPSLAGRKGSCSKCAAGFVVPAPALPLIEKDWQTEPPPAAKSPTADSDDYERGPDDEHPFITWAAPNRKGTYFGGNLSILIGLIFIMLRGDLVGVIIGATLIANGIFLIFIHFERLRRSRRRGSAD